MTQGKLLSPITFSICINDLQTVVNRVKYVDDSSLCEACHKSGGDSYLQGATNQVSAWTVKNDMQANTDKTKYMEIYFGTVPLTLHPIVINDSEIEIQIVFKVLGFMIDHKLSWNEYVEYEKENIFSIFIKRVGRSPTGIIDTYKAIIRSVLEYVCIVWHPA